MRLGDVKRRHVQRARRSPRRLGARRRQRVRNAIMPLRVIFRRALRDELVAVNPVRRARPSREPIAAARDRLARARGRARRRARDDVRPGAMGDCPLRRAPSRRAHGAPLGRRRPGERRPSRRAFLRSEGGRVRRAEVALGPASRPDRRRAPRRARRAPCDARHRPEPSALVFGESGLPFDDDALRQPRSRRLAEGGARADRSPCREAYGGLDDDRRRREREGALDFLGHASITITLDRYGHLLPGSITEATTLLDAFLGRTGARTGARDEKPLQIEVSRRS